MPLYTFILCVGEVVHVAQHAASNPLHAIELWESALIKSGPGRYRVLLPGVGETPESVGLELGRSTMVARAVDTEDRAYPLVVVRTERLRQGQRTNPPPSAGARGRKRRGNWRPKSNGDEDGDGDSGDFGGDDDREW